MVQEQFLWSSLRTWIYCCVALGPGACVQHSWGKRSLLPPCWQVRQDWATATLLRDQDLFVFIMCLLRMCFLLGCPCSQQASWASSHLG